MILTMVANAIYLLRVISLVLLCIELFYLILIVRNWSNWLNTSCYDESAIYF